MNSKLIRTMAYELYKLDWMDGRVTTQMQMDTIRNYYSQISDDNSDYTLEDYIEDGGYEVGIYACFGEFIGNEYLDKEYMKKLLYHDKMYMDYLEDVKCLMP